MGQHRLVIPWNLLEARGPELILPGATDAMFAAVQDLEMAAIRESFVRQCPRHAWRLSRTHCR